MITLTIAALSAHQAGQLCEYAASLGIAANLGTEEPTPTPPPGAEAPAKPRGRPKKDDASGAGGAPTGNVQYTAGGTKPTPEPVRTAPETPPVPKMTLEELRQIGSEMVVLCEEKRGTGTGGKLGQEILARFGATGSADLAEEHYAAAAQAFREEIEKLKAPQPPALGLL